jgi:hypothetical protein
MRRGSPSLRPAAFPPRSPPPMASALFEASSVLCSRPTPPGFLSGFAQSFPPRPGIAGATAGDRRSPRFRCVPFQRDVVSDSGRATAPRRTVLLVLPSTLSTASASARSGFRSSIHTPQDRCVRFAIAVTDDRATLATGRPATVLPGPDFHRLERANFAWRTDSSRD